ncbi:UNVERIFIED_CONTAM: hypothetical protein K2H54_025167 [Gekko kuhli]
MCLETKKRALCFYKDFPCLYCASMYRELGSMYKLFCCCCCFKWRGFVLILKALAKDQARRDAGLSGGESSQGFLKEKRDCVEPPSSDQNKTGVQQRLQDLKFLPA